MNQQLEKMKAYLEKEQARELNNVREWRKIGDKENEWMSVGSHTTLALALYELEKISKIK
jgi:hypothetical protein